MFINEFNYKFNFFLLIIFNYEHIINWQEKETGIIDIHFPISI
jgi:hypothetical protein